MSIHTNNKPKSKANQKSQNKDSNPTNGYRSRDTQTKEIK